MAKTTKSESKTDANSEEIKSKGSKQFKEVIETYLNKRATEDSLFADTLKKPNKNINECINYIVNTVQKSGQIGFADDEIFQMAIHYYDEDDIKVGKSSYHPKVVVNHTVDLTEDEKAKAKQAAIDELISEEKNKIKVKPVVKKMIKKTEGSLFD